MKYYLFKNVYYKLTIINCFKKCKFVQHNEHDVCIIIYDTKVIL